MKKIYTIIETRKVVNAWYYEVEAESEEAAMQMVKNGDVQPDDFMSDDYELGENSEFECINQYEK